MLNICFCDDLTLIKVSNSMLRNPSKPYDLQWKCKQIKRLEPPTNAEGALKPMYFTMEWHTNQTNGAPDSRSKAVQTYVIYNKKRTTLEIRRYQVMHITRSNLCNLQQKHNTRQRSGVTKSCTWHAQTYVIYNGNTTHTEIWNRQLMLTRRSDLWKLHDKHKGIKHLESPMHAHELLKYNQILMET